MGFPSFRVCLCEQVTRDAVNPAASDVVVSHTPQTHHPVGSDGRPAPLRSCVWKFNSKTQLFLKHTGQVGECAHHRRSSTMRENERSDMTLSRNPPELRSFAHICIHTWDVTATFAFFNTHRPTDQTNRSSLRQQPTTLLGNVYR